MKYKGNDISIGYSITHLEEEVCACITPLLQAPKNLSVFIIPQVQHRTAIPSTGVA